MGVKMSGKFVKIRSLLFAVSFLALAALSMMILTMTNNGKKEEEGFICPFLLFTGRAVCRTG